MKLLLSTAAAITFLGSTAMATSYPIDLFGGIGVPQPQIGMPGYEPQLDAKITDVIPDVDGGVPAPTTLHQDPCSIVMVPPGYACVPRPDGSFIIVQVSFRPPKAPWSDPGRLDQLKIKSILDIEESREALGG